MKAVKFALLCSLAFLCGCTPDDAVSQQTADKGVVFYYDFAIQRITGLHEEEIESYGCRFEILRQDFERSIVTRRAGQERYNSRDVRAKILFGRDTIFIDSSGVAIRAGGDEFAVDKAAFARALIPVGSCDAK